ncbi:hypothetical protein QR680_013864 [Steinernema hermaphroditum]|uniref:Chitin-binding type-2 domain-containing protein n=1 Tax=Steinernema hermaphroditum TaxID=289476 RepID=A0AA39I6Y0_9BILA|nr:hypothetical protein QR680_013864 [Steinernema hermaphroditum]
MGWRSTVVLLLFAAAINVSAIDSGPTCHDKSDGFYALRSCSSVFYSCQYGNVMTLHCPAPQFFNEESGFCEHDCSVTPVHVADEVTHCRHNEMDEIMACTRLFKICKHGQFEAAECPEGYVFKNSARMCVPEKECGVPERVAHEVTHCRHNEMEEVIECNQLFKICRHGRFEAAECPEGYVFKSSERMCVPEKECGVLERVADEVTHCRHNEMEEIMACTRLFKICKHGQFEAVECPEGYVFKKSARMCVPEKECGVLERVADEVTHCRHNEMEEIMACTRLFKICKHGQFEAAECPEGYVFKKSARMCVPEKECGVPERVAHEATLCRHNETEEMIECAQLFKIGVIPDHFAVSDDIRPIRSPLHTDQGAILDHFAVPGDTKPIRSPLHTDQGAILDHFAVPDDTKPIRSPLHTDQGAILDHFAVPDDTKPIRSPLHTDQGAILDHFAVPDDTKPIRSPLHTDQAAIRDHFAVPDDIEPITSPFPRFSDTPRYITDSFAIKWEVTNDSGKRSKRSLSMTDCSQWPSDSIVYDCMTFYHACVNGKVVRRSCPIGYFLEPRTITCMPTDPRNGCVKLNPPHEVFTKKDAPVVSDVNNTASAEYTKNTTENSNKTVESLSNVQKHEIGEVVPSEAPSTDVSANVTGESNSTSLESSLPPATKVSTAPTTDSHPRTCINNKLIEGQGRPLKACGHHYLICRQGKVHLLRCPGTQVFVESENTCISRWMRKECEWDTISKENADVEEGSVSIPSKSSGETASEDDYSSPTETPVLESGLPVSSSGGGMINLSPCSNRVDGFYRHPTNCSGIIQCFGGVAFHHPSCYADLVFNEKTGSCMLPKSDDNCAKIRRERVEKVAKATTDDTIRTCTDDQHGEFLRHESECNLYYRCVWGQAQLMDCPKGTVFNIDLGVCDYPNNAGLEMLLFLLLCVGTCAINIREEEIEYLERFGYIDNSGPAAQRTEQFLKERIREFQEMAALPMTGEMDDATRRMMRTPRCGRKDHVAKDRVAFIF